MGPGSAADGIPVNTPDTSKVLNIRFSYRSTLYLSSADGTIMETCLSL